MSIAAIKKEATDIIKEHGIKMSMLTSLVYGTANVFRSGKERSLIPFAIPTENLNEVEIYQNLTLPAYAAYDIGYEYRNAEAVKNLGTYKQYESDMTDPKAKLKWTDPAKTVGRTVRMSMVRYLRDHLLVPGSDHELRAIAEKINAINLISGYYSCEEAQDYVTMFECKAGSCMYPGKKDTITKDSPLRHRMYRDLNVWPSMWYHYCPNILGVYTQVNDEVVSRSFILNEKNFGSEYAISTIYSVSLTNLLLKQGFVRKQDRINITEVFEVPPIEYKGHLYCPLPFHDDVNNGYYVYFDKDKKMFSFGPKDKMPKDSQYVGNCYAFNGYVTEKLTACPQ